jgi:hypothetical protein
MLPDTEPCFAHLFLCLCFFGSTLVNSIMHSRRIKKYEFTDFCSQPRSHHLLPFLTNFKTWLGLANDPLYLKTIPLYGIHDQSLNCNSRSFLCIIPIETNYRPGNTHRGHSLKLFRFPRTHPISFQCTLGTYASKYGREWNDCRGSMPAWQTVLVQTLQYIQTDKYIHTSSGRTHLINQLPESCIPLTGSLVSTIQVCTFTAVQYKEMKSWL